jgi:peptidoglycan/LPS O-acetylase OafA/YrhL
MKRNYFIDILKAICMIFIILDHYSMWDDLRLLLLFPYWITMAVPILMILSGYVYAMSFERHSIHTLRAAYQPMQLLGRLLRFAVPFLIAYVLELMVSSLSNGFSTIIGIWGHDFLMGGWGPGSYYTPVMIQFVFVFPLVFVLIKKYDHIGLLLCGIFNACFEIFQRWIQMGGTCYKLLLFRYLLLIAFGCYLFIGKHRIPKWAHVTAFFVGAVFIFLYNYADYEPYILVYRTGTSMIAVLFIMPLVAGFLRSDRLAQLRCRPLEAIGKASYNIYLVQMVYFNYIADRVYALGFPIVWANLINLAFCLLGGIVFYLIEHKITNKIQSIFINLAR